MEFLDETRKKERVRDYHNQLQYSHFFDCSVKLYNSACSIVNTGKNLFSGFIYVVLLLSDLSVLYCVSVQTVEFIENMQEGEKVLIFTGRKIT